jgi:AraC-like DNA-binding protein
MGLRMNFEFMHNSFIDIQYRKFNSLNNCEGFHIHDEYEIVYVINGHGCTFIEGNVHSYTMGDVILTKSSELHASLHDVSCIRILFDPTVIRDLTLKENNLLDFFDKRPRGCNNIIRTSFDEANLIQKITEDILGLSYNNPQNIEARLLIYFLELLHLLSTLYESYKDKSFQSAYSPHLREIIDYININYDKDLRLCKVCSEFYISPQHLNRLFKKTSGGTVHDYIVSQRLKRSKELLRDGHSVCDSCHLSGFKDYSNFIRLFKARIGTSPGKYARLHRK